MKWTATLAVAAVTVGLATAVCPEGFEDFDETETSELCLMFLKTPTTWTSMRTLCQLFDADLVKVSGRLHELLVTHITDNSELQYEAFWIGGTDSASEGIWRWVIDNTEIPLGTPHWYPCDGGNPNGGTNQNYLTLYPPDFYFQDLSNEYSLYGICQYIPPTVPAKP